MSNPLAQVDQALTKTRPGWGWLGQAAVMVLGVHLAADRLDDLMYDALMWASLPWPDPGTPTYLSSWAAVWLELAVVSWALWTLAIARSVPAGDWNEWKQRASLMAFVRPAFWLPVSLTGAWVVGMAVEDLIAPYHAELAHYTAYVVGALIAWRLGLTGFWTVASAVRDHTTRVDGWWWAPAPLLIAGLSLRFGIPIWGLW